MSIFPTFMLYVDKVSTYIKDGLSEERAKQYAWQEYFPVDSSREILVPNKAAPAVQLTRKQVKVQKGTNKKIRRGNGNNGRVSGGGSNRRSVDTLGMKGNSGINL